MRIIRCVFVAVLPVLGACLLTPENTAADQPKSMDLYLLIGQSNMAGRGKVAKEDKTPHPRVFMLNKKDQWVPAVDPIHFDKSIAGVGPGTAFGKAMAEANPESVIGLIPCAHGGSPISVWKTGAYFASTRSKPYDEALRRTAAALKSGKLKGILWHQGESDSNEKLTPLYAERLADLVMRLRRDLNAPSVPFLVGGMSGPLQKRNPYAAKIDEILQQLPKRVKQTAYVSAEGLKLKSDKVHFTAEASRELGRRYAAVMVKLVEGR